MAENDQQQQDEQKAKQDEGTKQVPLKDLVAQREARRAAEARVAELEARIEEAESGKLSELDKLKKENEKLQRTLAGHVQSTRKAMALDKALAEIGEGFHIDDKQMPSVKKLIEAVAYDEKTIDDIAKEVVEAAKRPKTSTVGASPLRGQPVVGEFGKPGPNGRAELPTTGIGVTPMQLAQLAAQDPEAYARTMADLQAGKLKFAS